MSEFPLLCINAHCRPAEHGGPRRTERAWFCPVCIEKAAEHLRFIADSWGDLEDMLTRGSSPASEPTTGTRDVGLELNEKASAARARVSADLWAYARIVLDWADEAGRNVRGPADQSVPGIARWLASWHMAVFTVHAGQSTAGAFMDDVWADRRAVRSAAYPSGAKRVPTGLPCTEHETSEDGGRVACTGTMYAWVSPQASAMPDLICTEDDTHRVDPATWMRAGWKRGIETPNPSGMARLAERMGL